MINLIVKRSLQGIVIVFVALSIIFVAAHGIGDPAIATLGANASPEVLEQWREEHGLNDPFYEQYGRYVGALFTGDLGTSYRDSQPVAEVILTRLPRTLLMSGMALSMEICFGLFLGTLAALRKGTTVDTGLMGLAYLGISLPTFVTGPVLLLVFCFLLGWFPIGGYGVGFWDHVYHGLLPAGVMALLGAATYARVMRSEMIDTMHSDYIRTARAKGLSETRVVLGHGVRNAMLPIVTIMGLSFPLLVNGAIITEAVFNWPGMGRLALEAIVALDAPMVLGIALIVAVAVQLGNLLADIGVGLLDPRVRVGGGS